MSTDMGLFFVRYAKAMFASPMLREAQRRTTSPGLNAVIKFGVAAHHRVALVVPDVKRSAPK